MGELVVFLCEEIKFLKKGKESGIYGKIYTTKITVRKPIFFDEGVTGFVFV